MSLKLCTTAWMYSTTDGTGLSDAWLPNMVNERLVGSTHDNTQVERAPDPVPYIEADMTWTNQTGTWQTLRLSTQRATRSLVSSNPNTIAMDDAESFAVGANPNAPRPTTINDGIRTRLKSTPSSLSDVIFGRIFRTSDDQLDDRDLGAIANGETVHIRYALNLTTPGEWRPANEPMHQAAALVHKVAVVCVPVDYGGAMSEPLEVATPDGAEGPYVQDADGNVRLQGILRPGSPGRPAGPVAVGVSAVTVGSHTYSPATGRCMTHRDCGQAVPLEVLEGRT